MCKYAQTSIRLRGFAEPDTSSQVEGRLDPGKYVVLDYKANYPNEDTDYALLDVPVLGAGDTWTCSRWKGHRYAEIFEINESDIYRAAFEQDEMTISEDALTDLLPLFAPFTYTPDRARYPFELNGFRVPLAPPEQNNCCTFVEALLVKAWQGNHGDFVWDPERHAQMMIFSNDDFYSPVTASVESGMAVGVDDPDQAPAPWTLIQGWRRQWRGGHTFIIVDHDQASDRILTLESNSAYKLNGVGFRELGNLRDADLKPPQNWRELEDLWTWRDVQATYLYRRQARLKVKSRNWSG